MKWISYTIILCLCALVLWINVPVTIPLRFTVASRTFDLSVHPLVLNFTLFGKRYVRDFKTRLGLDLRGGSHLVFEANISKVKPADLTDALNASRDIIERRVNLFGVSEPQIRTIRSGMVYRISVDLPGIQDIAQAVSLIGQTAQLRFMEMKDDLDPKTATTTPLFMLLTKESKLNGTHITKANVDFNSQTGSPEVALHFTKEGGNLFGDITGRNVGKPVGIYLDNTIISAPTVQRAITDGNAVITGQFSLEEAKKLAIAINSGALPLPIKLVEQRNIGPSLGKVEVERSLVAGLTGLAMVMLFMVIYYGRLGVIACIGLMIYGLITFALFRAIPIVLTLPGIAGFILSIGMAVDSNILIFERIKEERQKGKSVQSAVQAGFGRAIDAIKDANITTLLVAFILFNPLNWDFFPQFGLVRGFALTLALGVATSLFTGVVVTKRLISIFYKT